MAVPRAFWVSASVALVLIAASGSYYLLAVLPAAERHRNELAAEIARKQANDKQAMDCAEESRLAGQDMSKYSSGFGPPSNVSGVSNHYNHKLSKCIVDVQTVNKNSTAEFVMDAYEQSSILWCMTQFQPKASSPMQRTCMDSKNNRIDPTEADKQIDALMRD
jgi:hypothetical protein